MNKQNPELHGAMAPPAPELPPIPPPPVPYQPHFDLQPILPPPAPCHYYVQYPISHGGQFTYLNAGYIAAFVGPDGVPLPEPAPPLGPQPIPGSQPAAIGPSDGVAAAPSLPGQGSSPPPTPSPSPPPPTPSPSSPPSPPQNRKRPRTVNLENKYIPVLDFLDKHPPIKAFKFRVGSRAGNIPRKRHVKTTIVGSTVLDGFVEYFTKLHESGKSYGGNFSTRDMLVAKEDPLHVTVNKVATQPATMQNIKSDLLRLVDCLVRRRYVQAPKKAGEVKEWPAYVRDFIDRIRSLKTGPFVDEKDEKEWTIQIWVIRNHPLLVVPSTRRTLLEDYYKYYKSLHPKTAAEVIQQGPEEKQAYPRWQVLTVSKDNLLATAYWKKDPLKCPADYFTKDHAKFPDRELEENFEVYIYTSENGYLGVFLRNFIVHEKEEPMACDITLEELDLIVAYHFEKFLPAFLEDLHCYGENGARHVMTKEILAVYELRRSVSREAPGSDEETSSDEESDDVERRSKRSRYEEGRDRDRERHWDLDRDHYRHRRHHDRDGKEKECDREKDKDRRSCDRKQERDRQWRSRHRSEQHPDYEERDRYRERNVRIERHWDLDRDRHHDRDGKEKECDREKDKDRRSCDRKQERERDRQWRSRHRSEQHPDYEERDRYRERNVRRRKEEVAEPEVDPERDQRTVLAYKMSSKADETDLYEFFARARKVRDVHIIIDRNSRHSKGVGYIEFYDAKSIPMALALSGQLLLGEQVMVKPSDAEKKVQSDASSGAASGGARKLYVGNLPSNINEDQLREALNASSRALLRKKLDYTGITSSLTGVTGTGATLPITTSSIDLAPPSECILLKNMFDPDLETASI